MNKLAMKYLRHKTYRTLIHIKILAPQRVDISQIDVLYPISRFLPF